MAKKNKRSAPAAGKDPGRLQGEKGSRRLDPMARKLILAAVILVAAARLLDTHIPQPVGDAMTLLGGILAVGALISQLRGENKSL